MYKILYLIDPPGPTGVPQVIDVQKRSMALKWTPPEIDGGSPITGYIVEYRYVGGFKWNRGNEGESSINCAHEVTGLKENEEYEFRVAATNRAGTGPFTQSPKPIKAVEPIGKLNLPLANMLETHIIIHIREQP